MKTIATYVLIALLLSSFWSMLAAVGLMAKLYPAWVVPAVFGLSLAVVLTGLLIVGGGNARKDGRA